MGEQIEAPWSPPPGKSQPIQAISPDTTPVLDDNAVRQAIAHAEANNQDPMTIRRDELSQGQVSPAPVPVPEVPQKFLKPDGAVDVEKIQASTKALDEAIQNREPVPQKTVADYLKEYQDKEKLFRSGTVPKAMAPAPPMAPVEEVSPQNFEEIVRRDYQADPLGTTTRLMELMLQRKFAPVEEREKVEATRTNLQGLVDKDPRVLRQDVYDAINAKLAADPELWKLKNPHKAAWLEVKEEMRLGDPNPGQAQPSRPSPVLGGGTPPSAPSSSVQTNPQDVISNLHKLDLRDKNQEALGDEAIRKVLMGNRG